MKKVTSFLKELAGRPIAPGSKAPRTLHAPGPIDEKRIAKMDAEFRRGRQKRTFSEHVLHGKIPPMPQMNGMYADSDEVRASFLSVHNLRKSAQICGSYVCANGFHFSVVPSALLPAFRRQLLGPGL